MPLFTVMMIIIFIGSFTLMSLVIWRLLCYKSKYHLPESKYTKLFGFISKEHIAFIYVVAILSHIVFGILFMSTL